MTRSPQEQSKLSHELTWLQEMFRFRKYQYKTKWSFQASCWLWNALHKKFEHRVRNSFNTSEKRLQPVTSFHHFLLKSSTPSVLLTAWKVTPFHKFLCLYGAWKVTPFHKFLCLYGEQGEHSNCSLFWPTVGLSAERLGHRGCTRWSVALPLIFIHFTSSCLQASFCVIPWSIKRIFS